MRTCQSCGTTLEPNRPSKLCPPCRHKRDTRQQERYRRTVNGWKPVKSWPYPKYLLSYIADFYGDSKRAMAITAIYRRQTGWHIPISGGSSNDTRWAGGRESSRGRKARADA